MFFLKTYGLKIMLSLGVMFLVLIPMLIVIKEVKNVIYGEDKKIETIKNNNDKLLDIIKNNKKIEEDKKIEKRVRRIVKQKSKKEVKHIDEVVDKKQVTFKRHIESIKPIKPKPKIIESKPKIDDVKETVEKKTKIEVDEDSYKEVGEASIDYLNDVYNTLNLGGNNE